ncbi:ECF RNA polymerase sigma-E factor [Planctomyces sp. SH-PL14]|nr:ECF RNA polymerase sigma-E factor [Planctomyces sp. SH-PL14]
MGITSSGTCVVTGTMSSPYLKDPDVQLMLRVKKGDEQAFGQLVSNYQDRLIGLLTNMVGDRETAEDLTQELFLRVYRARNGYEANAKFSTWVFSIAHNLASNSRRSKGRRKEVALAPADSGAQSTGVEANLAEKSAMMPTRQLAKNELMERVQDAIGQLNERQRMGLLLHKFEGLSYEDIGLAMEMTPQAVKSLLSRAREQLREVLESYVK